MSFEHCASEWPFNFFGGGASNPSDSNWGTINGAGDAWGVSLQAWDLNAILGGTVGFRSNAGGSDDISIQLYDADATTREPTTLKAGVTADITPASNDGVDFTFGSSWTPSSFGEWFNVVFRAVSGYSSGDSDIASIRVVGSGAGRDGWAKWSSANITAGTPTWTREGELNRFMFGLRSSGGIWYPHRVFMPIADNVGSNSSLEKGLHFRPWRTFRARGFAFAGDWNGVTGDVRVYSGSGAPGTGTAVAAVNETGGAEEWKYYYFDDEQEFIQDSDYRITFDSDSGSFYWTCLELKDHARNGNLGVADGYNDHWHYCEDDGASGWDDSSLDIPYCQFLDVSLRPFVARRKLFIMGSGLAC